MDDLFFAGTVVAGAGLAGLLLAGRRMTRGELDAARRQARPAGLLTAAGGLAMTAGAWPSPGSAVCAFATAGIALLGGLSGKPRPAGGAALLAWAVAIGWRLLLD